MPKKKALRRLIRHMWVHSGYPCNGYGQMDFTQKRLYCKVIGAEFEEFDRDFLLRKDLAQEKFDGYRRPVPFKARGTPR